MHAPNASLFAGDGRDLNAVIPGKIGPGIPKQDGAPPAPPGLDSTGDQMAGNTNNGNGTSAAESVRIWKARNYIHEHAGEELSLGKVARAANTSANYFSEKFKEATGVNFVRYVAQARFEKATQLMRQADLRVSEIAFAVGFQSLSQFNRVFKKFAGISPTEFRAAARVHEDTGIRGSTEKQADCR